MDVIVVRFAVLLYLVAAFGGGEAAPAVQVDHAPLWAAAGPADGDSQSSDDDTGDDDDDDDAGPVSPDTSWVPNVMPVLFAPRLIGRIVASSDAAPPSAVIEPLFRPPRALSA